DYLKKTWGIEFKSASVDKSGEVKLLLEFSKDLTDLKAMREALSPYSGIPKATQVRLYFYCFDQDNVSLGKSWITKLEGELSGQQGDAFKLAFNLPPNSAGKVRKVEVRPNELAEKAERK